MKLVTDPIRMMKIVFIIPIDHLLTKVNYLYIIRAHDHDSKPGVLVGLRKLAGLIKYTILVLPNPNNLHGIRKGAHVKLNYLKTNSHSRLPERRFHQNRQLSSILPSLAFAVRAINSMPTHILNRSHHCQNVTLITSLSLCFI